MRAGERVDNILEVTGPFGQDKSFDHLVRDRAGFDRIRRYLECNPVAAGLAARLEEFLWSSAAPPGRADPTYTLNLYTVVDWYVSPGFNTVVGNSG